MVNCPVCVSYYYWLKHILTSAKIDDGVNQSHLGDWSVFRIYDSIFEGEDNKSIVIFHIKVFDICLFHHV